MYRIIDNKASGKTHQLMEIAKETNSVFVCNNPRAMEAKAHAYGIVGIEFIDYYAFLDSRGKDTDKFVIDEMEMFLRYACKFHGLNGELVGYTLTNGD
jgi:hypothetical protein